MKVVRSLCHIALGVPLWYAAGLQYGGWVCAGLLVAHIGLTAADMR